jgi:hypothetical protein
VLHCLWVALVGLWGLVSIKIFWALWGLVSVKGLCALLTHIWGLVTFKAFGAAFVNFVLVVISTRPCVVFSVCLSAGVSIVYSGEASLYGGDLVVIVCVCVGLVAFA